ncbi:predicted protein [Naegleria gruberi]|uniref:Predicted protein n=1 Tax=Naegleria gruberi TaxID=5762 RepID=D2V503_NAEGR|nr:uncharacterized protein NAEGRDRAFT_63966 [Naegleria gruberi]EFC48021.1 predicted protein [Naegleria gruberi]|eukprot:XP_002680765.1 predicted protein [Naegleria gruberi strain NEG-M]
MPKSHEVWSEAQFVNVGQGMNTATHKYTTSTNEELFPIACGQCRKLHKRCDKKLPSCSKCVSKGLTCTYQEPKKKGRTKGSKNHVTSTEGNSKNQQSNSGENTPSPLNRDDNSNENSSSPPSVVVENIPQCQSSSQNSNVKTPYGTNLVNISNNLVNNVMNPITSVENMLSQTPSFLRTMRMNLIDAYYEIVSLGYPLIERSELERYMFSQDQLNDRKEILAFVLSIQGLCQQRFGYSDLATDSIEKSALVLKDCFDGYSDFYTAATYSNFAYYFLGEGDTKKSRFYNHFVEFYLKELDEFANIYQQNLRWIKLLVDYLGNPRFPYLSPVDLIGFFNSVVDKDMPTEWKNALFDFAGTNISNCEERLAIFHCITDSMQKMRRGSLISSIIYDVIYGVLKTGLSISIYSFVDLIHFRQTIFDLIVKMFNISDNEYFSFSPPIVIPYMIVSAKILLEMEKVIATGELNTNGIDYYNSKTLRHI